MPPKKYDTAELKDAETGKVEKVRYRQDGLHISLGIPQDEDLPKGIMEKIKAKKVGDKIKVKGKPRDPAENEKGWKDTVVSLPGEVTRVIAKFDRKGRYVWHCHILSHEDHEMMRPFEVK